MYLQIFILPLKYFLLASVLSAAAEDSALESSYCSWVITAWPASCIALWPGRGHKTHLRFVRAESASVCVVLRWARSYWQHCTFSHIFCSHIKHVFFMLISRISMTVSTYSYFHTSCHIATFYEASVQFSFAWWTFENYILAYMTQCMCLNMPCDNMEC